MKSKLVWLSAAVVVLGIVVWAWPSSRAAAQEEGQAEEQVWTGVVSDSMCGLKWSEPSEEAATDVKKCVSEKGAKYVLVSEGKLFQLEPQEKFAEFPGQKVKVSGTEKDGTITASSVEAAEQAEGDSED
jgi:hypothetical protein